MVMDKTKGEPVISVPAEENKDGEKPVEVKVKVEGEAENAAGEENKDVPTTEGAGRLWILLISTVDIVSDSYQKMSEISV